MMIRKDEELRHRVEGKDKKFTSFMKLFKHLKAHLEQVDSSAIIGPDFEEMESDLEAFMRKYLPTAWEELKAGDQSAPQAE